MDKVNDSIIKFVDKVKKDSKISCYVFFVIQTEDGKRAESLEPANLSDTIKALQKIEELQRIKDNTTVSGSNEMA